jgi:hypothetical protein
MALRALSTETGSFDERVEERLLTLDGMVSIRRAVAADALKVVGDRFAQRS